MTRLNKDIRSDIVQNAVDKAVSQRKDNLTTLRKEIANEAYKMATKDVDEPKLVKKAKRLIEELSQVLDADVINAIEANTLSQRIRVNYNGQRIDARFDGARLSVTGVSHWFNKGFPVPANTRLADMCDNFFKEEARIKEISESVRANVRATVESVTTVKKLLELWPEAAELLPETESKGAALPVVQRDQLNTMIGLPSDEDK